MLQSLQIAGAGVFALFGASVIVAGLARWTRAPAPARPQPQPGATVFLFEGQDLVDATPEARRLLRGRDRRASDLAGLLALLSRGFGADLGQRLAALPMAGRLLLASATGAGTLEAREEGGALRLTLRPDEVGASALDQLAFAAALDELELLRSLAEDAPQPIWALDGTGALAWANRAYLALADLSDPANQPERPRAAWPMAPLFDAPAELRPGEVRQQRLPRPLPGREEPLWYDVTSARRGPGSLHFAADVTGLVLAESARRHFVQSLAKTFAHLRTGLAIFDRERRLALFNPAFMDLTGLPPDFLSGRPVVDTVLDRLRDAKILPEPRDYATWREEVAALEAAAAQDQYCETWTLPGGQTYRVTGRPHPDGALAFLFEDISDEVGLTRRFRADLDTTRAALDAIGDAVAVFSATGALDLANAAYAELWLPTDAGPGGADLAGELARWEAGCVPSPIWARLREGPSETLPRRRDGCTASTAARSICASLPCPEAGRS